MLDARTGPGALRLRSGPRWPSFESLRKGGSKALESIRKGFVATLSTKTGQYRILVEEDFQYLLGLARDVHRLKGGLSVVLLAAQAAEKHKDEETIRTLITAVGMFGRLPALPVRDGNGDLVPEGIQLEDDDEAILDANELYSLSAEELR